MGFMQSPNYKNQTFSQFMTEDYEEMGQTIAASAYGKSEPGGTATRTWWAVHTKEGMGPSVSKTHWCQSDGFYTFRTDDAMDAAGHSPMPVSVFRKAKALGVDVEAFEQHRRKKEQEHAEAVERYRREFAKS